MGGSVSMKIHLGAHIYTKYIPHSLDMTVTVTATDDFKYRIHISHP